MDRKIDGINRAMAKRLEGYNVRELVAEVKELRAEVARLKGEILINSKKG